MDGPDLYILCTYLFLQLQSEIGPVEKGEESQYRATHSLLHYYYVHTHIYTSSMVDCGGVAKSTLAICLWYQGIVTTEKHH